MKIEVCIIATIASVTVIFDTEVIMKILIWIGCFFTTALIQSLFGMKLGGIPAAMFFGATFTIAKNFVARYENRNNKTGKKYAETSKGLMKGFLWYGATIFYVILGTIFVSADPASFDFGTQIIIAIICIGAAIAGHILIDEKVQLKYFEENEAESAETVEINEKICFCRKCGAKLLEDSVFCDKCGTKIITQFEQPSAPNATPTPSFHQSPKNISELNTSQNSDSNYLHQAQIRQERNEALAKRVVTTQTAEKKKKIIKIAVIVAIVAVVVALIINAVVESAHNSELRNFATETMNEDYTNVYADVVSMEPEYFVYNHKTTSSGVKIGNGNLWEVVCKCKTVEGKTIWVTFFYQYYPEGDYSKNEDDYKAFTYSYDNPLRLYGSVDTARQVVDELEDEIGNVFVLDVKEKPKQ